MFPSKAMLNRVAALEKRNNTLESDWIQGGYVIIDQLVRTFGKSTVIHLVAYAMTDARDKTFECCCETLDEIAEHIADWGPVKPN